MSLFDDIKILDPGIADAFQKATQKTKTKTDPDGAIDLDGVNAIFEQAIFGDKDESLTPAEVKALLLIRAKAKFTAEGLKNWEAALLSTLTVKALVKGSGKLLKTKADLAEVNQALDLAALHVNFRSPRTNLTYDAGQYQAMKKLLEQGEILAVEVNAQGMLGPVAAFYDPKSNTMFLMENLPDKTVNIAHEMTHAIQDWNDFVAKGARKFVEADAYIAQGLVQRAQIGKLKQDNPIGKAVEVIKANKATMNNIDWFNPKWKPLVQKQKEKPGVYDEVAELVMTFDTEKNKPPDVDMKSGESKDEAKQLGILLKQLKQSKKTP